MTNQTLLMNMFLSSVLKFILIFLGGTEMCADPVSLLDGLPWEILVPRDHLSQAQGISSSTRDLETLGLGLHLLIDFGLSAEVANTILNYKAPFTKWQLFVSWTQLTTLWVQDWSSFKNVLQWGWLWL